MGNRITAKIEFIKISVHAQVKGEIMRVIPAIVLLTVLFGNGFAQRRMTDAEFDGFKGPVKSVIEEAEWTPDPSEGGNGKKRQVTFERLYDKSGNVMQYKNNGAGFKQVFSIIDGFKTYKHHDISVPGLYGGESPPAPPPFGRGDLSKNPSDPRFSIRFEYKYDSKGRVAEEISYLSNGSLLVRVVHQYDARGDHVEEKTYYNEIIRRIERTYFDKNAHAILETEESPGDRGTTNRMIRKFDKYRADNKGNWTERKETTVATHGNSVTEIVFTRLRMIVYY